MNVKFINSKLDFLEDLIVEMNPENLEEFKKLCFQVISDVIWEVKVFEEAMNISKNYPYSLGTTALLVRAAEKLKEKGFDVDLMNFAVHNSSAPVIISNILNEDLDPQRFDKDYSASKEATRSFGFFLANMDFGLTTTKKEEDIIPKVGDVINIEFSKPKLSYDKPKSKYINKPKNNFKKR